LAPSHSTQPSFIKPLAGLAVAASVAAVAILGIQNYQQGNITVEGQPIQLELLSSTTSPLEYGVPVEPRISPSVGDASARPVQLQIQSDSRISRYILNHSEYRSNMGVQGMTPHIRLVATESNENE
jgi:negative regulator of sigma E activity